MALKPTRSHFKFILINKGKKNIFIIKDILWQFILNPEFNGGQYIMKLDGFNKTIISYPDP